MATFPGFCDFHKRWFTGSCDYCDRDEEIALSHKHTAAKYAALLAPHAEHGHLSNQKMTLPDGRTMTIADLQDYIWNLEHSE